MGGRCRVDCRCGGWRVVVDGSRGKGRTGKRTTAGCEEAEGGETAAAQDGTASCHSHERGGGSGHERTSRPPAKGISAKPGEAMPPLPDLHGIDEDFAKSFLTPITINEDDPENVKELKRNVIETKKELLEAVKGGKTVMQALQEHQAAMERMESSRLMAIREMQRISAEDGVEMAQEFAKKVNEDFEGKGIPAIPVIGNNGEKTRRGNK